MTFDLWQSPSTQWKVSENYCSMFWNALHHNQLVKIFRQCNHDHRRYCMQIILGSEDLLCMFLHTVHRVQFQLALRWWHNALFYLYEDELSHWFCINHFYWFWILMQNATVICYFFFFFYSLFNQFTEEIWHANKKRFLAWITSWPHAICL